MNGCPLTPFGAASVPRRARPRRGAPADVYILVSTNGHDLGSMTSDDPTLPDFERPPVVEIIAAVQFAPLPVFDIAQVIAIGREFDEWVVVDAPQAIPPMTEAPTPQTLGQHAIIGFGTPPVRVILTTENGRWTGQIQQDRVAVHERKVEARPSFTNVAPMLHDFSDRASTALGTTIPGEQHAADLVEVIYENRITPAAGGWSTLGELHRVLRIIDHPAGAPPFKDVEQATIAFSYALGDEHGFGGRLRVIAEPRFDGDGPAIGLRLTSRRFVRDADVDMIFHSCHADIVRGFTAITTEAMHEHWGRYR